MSTVERTFNIQVKFSGPEEDLDFILYPSDEEEGVILNGITASFLAYHHMTSGQPQINTNFAFVFLSDEAMIDVDVEEADTPWWEE